MGADQLPSPFTAALVLMHSLASTSAGRSACCAPAAPSKPLTVVVLAPDVPTHFCPLPQAAAAAADVGCQRLRPSGRGPRPGRPAAGSPGAAAAGAVGSTGAAAAPLLQRTTCCWRCRCRWGAGRRPRSRTGRAGAAGRAATTSRGSSSRKCSQSSSDCARPAAGGLREGCIRCTSDAGGAGAAWGAPAAAAGGSRSQQPPARRGPATGRAGGQQQ